MYSVWKIANSIFRHIMCKLCIYKGNMIWYAEYVSRMYWQSKPLTRSNRARCPVFSLLVIDPVSMTCPLSLTWLFWEPLVQEQTGCSGREKSKRARQKSIIINLIIVITRLQAYTTSRMQYRSCNQYRYVDILYSDRRYWVLELVRGNCT